MSSNIVTLSTVPLAAGATFTGNFEQVPAYGAGIYYTWIVGLSSSDQAGTIYVEQSMDGAHPLRSDPLNTAADSLGNQSSLLKVQMVYPYVRVKYTNGATKQTTFTLTRNFSIN